MEEKERLGNCLAGYFILLRRVHNRYAKSSHFYLAVSVIGTKKGAGMRGTQGRHEKRNKINRNGEREREKEGERGGGGVAQRVGAKRVEREKEFIPICAFD